MELEAFLQQTMEVPVAFIWGSFVCGCIFYFILDGISGIMGCLFAKIIQKIKDKKEKVKKDV